MIPTKSKDVFSILIKIQFHNKGKHSKNKGEQ